jgi:sec-independent protein translocase protein TatA
MNLGPLEIGIIVLLILVLFGYKKLPAASRSLGQSLRIFKGEMKGMKSDDAAGKDSAAAPPARELSARPAPSGDLTAQLQDEARTAENRARADRSGSVDGSH